MAAKEFSKLKGKQVDIGQGKMTFDTTILDGAAKDSPVFEEDNPTVQYKTPPLKVGEEGGQNDPNG